jgi:hypothetical protein
VLALEALLHLGVGTVGGQLGELGQVAGTRLELLPGGQLLSEPVGFAQCGLRAAGVVPEPGLAGRVFERAQALPFAAEVKGAPRSRGSAR